MTQGAGIIPDMTDAAFDSLAQMAHDNWGLVLVPEKRAMVASRLRHRVKARGLCNFNAYSDLVRSEAGSDEIPHMISALTTNVSHFFREPHHFDALAKSLASRLQKEAPGGARVRVWSAGCSNGQEPYSIAMHLLDAIPNLEDADFRILATDIDPKVIRFARVGEYEERELRGLPAGFRSRYTEAIDGGVRMSDRVKSLISFRQLNLLDAWPMQGLFDAIFCRNVVIYFDIATQDTLWPRFNAALQRGAMLFLGHSERMQNNEQQGFKTAGATAFTKVGAPGHLLQKGNQNGAA